jgi:hypothetical protein
MNEVACDVTDAQTLSNEISDDALEAAAGGSEIPGRTFYGCLPPMPLTAAYGCPAGVDVSMAPRKLP